MSEPANAAALADLMASYWYDVLEDDQVETIRMSQLERFVQLAEEAVKRYEERLKQ